MRLGGGGRCQRLAGGTKTLARKDFKEGRGREGGHRGAEVATLTAHCSPFSRGLSGGS